MIRFEIIEDSERFAAIHAPWQTLWTTSNGGVFQSHAWIAAWVSHAGPAFKLRIGVAWKDDRLVAVLPLAVRRYYGIRILEWAAQSLSDYCDCFGDLTAATSLWKMIQSRGIDVIRLKNVGPEAKANLFLHESRLITKADDCCMQVESLWPDGSAWFRTLNKKKRSNHTRGLKKLGELGLVAVEYHRTVPVGLIEHLVALKLGWLHAHELSSPLVENGPMLLMSLAQALAAVDKLCIVLIRCGDAVVAASINAVETTHLLAFFAAYDPKYDRCSPGILLMNEYTKWAFDNGFTVIDYLRGAESYKFEFTTKQVSLFSFLGARTLRGNLVLSLYRMCNTWKKTNNLLPKTMDSGGAYSTKAGTSRLGEIASV